MRFKPDFSRFCEEQDKGLCLAIIPVAFSSTFSSTLQAHSEHAHSSEHSRELSSIIRITQYNQHTKCLIRRKKVPRTRSSTNQGWWHLNTDCHSTTFNIIQDLNTTAILELFVVYALLYSIHSILLLSVLATTEGSTLIQVMHFIYTL